MVPKTCISMALAAAAMGGHGFFSSNAWAQATPRHAVELAYEVDPTLTDCPTAAEFRAIISDELGYDPHQANASTRITVRVLPTATGLSGELESTTVANRRLGERRFTAQSGECQRMVANLGFAVAVQLQLAIEQRDQATTLSKARGSHTTLTSPDSAHQEALASNSQTSVRLSTRRFELRMPPRPKGARWIFSLGIGPTVGIRVGPQTVVAGRLFGAVRRGWFGFELGAEASLPATVHRSYGDGFRYQLSLGTLAVCVWYGAISACGLGRLGQLRAEGVGVDVARSTSGIVASVGPRVSYALDLNRTLFVQGHVEGLASPTAWTVYVNHEPVWSLPRLALVAGIDFGARLP